MSQLYVLTREGVYRHEILGIFNVLNEAKINAKYISKTIDTDGYHSIDISIVELNQTCKNCKRILSYRKGVIEYEDVNSSSSNNASNINNNLS